MYTKYRNVLAESASISSSIRGEKMQPKPTAKISLCDGSSRQIAAALQEEIRRLEGVKPATRDTAPLTAGCAAIDRILPEGGLCRGWLTEWLGVEGGGAGTLALIAAREACHDGGALVVMDRWRRFYPPAAAGLGIDLETTILLRPQNAKDELWALDQVLRCGGVAAVWAPLENVDDHAFRRLQLAAEAGGVLGLLVRPANLRGKPSWSDVQLWIEPKVAGTLRVSAESRAVGIQTTPTSLLVGETDSQARKRGAQNIPFLPSAAASRRLMEETEEEQEGAASSLRISFTHEQARGGRTYFHTHAADGAGTVSATNRRFRIEVTRCRGGSPGGSVEVEFDDVRGVLRGVDSHDQTHPLPVAPALADSAATRRSTIA
jgi:hypothetical protein